MNKFTRGLFFLIGDTASLMLSAILAYITLYPFLQGPRAFPIEHTAIILVSIISGLVLLRMYLVNWGHMGLRDLSRIILGVTAGGLNSLFIAQFFWPLGNYEYAFTALMVMNGVLILSGFRISKRMYYELLDLSRSKKKHTIILGGKEEGEQIIRDILKNNQWNLSVFGLFDDRVVPGLRVHGIKNYGGIPKLLDYIRQNPVDQLIVAYPEMPKKVLKELIDDIRSIRSEMDIKILPSFHSLNDDPVGLKNVRDIRIEDILGREPVKIDMETIKSSIEDKVVLITGGGGSIGSELVRQCANFKPDKLIALDIDETELFHVENEIKNQGLKVIPCVANVTDESKLDQVMERYRPDVIFHAAAYKHVPMMESFPEEAIKVNVGGTRTLARLACKHDVEKFVLISTDKAVNPANAMGATKRIAEEICMAYNGLANTRFISVRFGNVLGSRGSVVPLFIDQIKNGGPVTVTDPEMRRYFMTIPEAVLLVMQAGSMGEGGEVFVLDMGNPVKIVDMAADLIRLHNLEPGKDIMIEFSGLRPGEKMFEVLLDAEEGVIKTRFEEIFKANCSRKLSHGDLESKINKLFNLLETGNADYLKYLLKSIVPSYAYKGAYGTGKPAPLPLNGAQKKSMVG